MRLREALNSAVQQLTAAGVGSSHRNAELLLRFALSCDRAHLYAHPERELTEGETERYRAAIVERARGVPAQYIIGHQEFWGLDLIVSPAVLIPRPETEHVIETVVELARDVSRLRIVDVGTGSGCIAIALATELPNATLHAVDVSPDALEVARANAARHQLSDRILFRQGDLLDGLLEQGEQFDFVVSNPPYVGESEEDQVQLEVRKFEPRMAVFAGPTGFEVITRLVEQATRALSPNGWLVMEIGQGQEAAVRDMLRDWQNLGFTPDLQRIPRVVAAQRP